MLTCSPGTNVARRINFSEPVSTDAGDARPRQKAVLLRIDTRLQERGNENNGRARCMPAGYSGNVESHVLQILPADVVNRRTKAWDGIRMEIIQSLTHDAVEFRFRAPCHLLLVYEEGVREEGETQVGDLPRSSLRTLRHKLTFVPAGHEYREGNRPRIRNRIICFYLDPAKMPIQSEAGSAAGKLLGPLPVLNNVLWDTAVKLAAAVEDGSENERYCEALAVVIAH